MLQAFGDRLNPAAGFDAQASLMIKLTIGAGFQPS